MKAILTAIFIFTIAVSLAACASTSDPAAADQPVEPAAETAAQTETSPTAAVSASNAPAAAPAGGSSAPAANTPARTTTTQTTPAAAPPPPPPPPAPPIQVAAGTTLAFTLTDPVSTATSQPGDTFRASLLEAVVVNGETVIPRNALANGRVVAVDGPGRVTGRARLELTITAIQVGGQMVSVDMVPFVAEADSNVGGDAARIGAGAAIGAAVGGILGGGRGAATGAAVGGGAGTAVVLATRGDQLELASESRVNLTLRDVLRIAR